ncbi:MAG: hypothetical protein JNK60_11260 [Acidobacteria bacterium]|nr:hypothetical protein [Acidobacteriota bacterium]
MHEDLERARLRFSEAVEVLALGEARIAERMREAVERCLSVEHFRSGDPATDRLLDDLWISLYVQASPDLNGHLLAAVDRTTERELRRLAGLVLEIAARLGATTPAQRTRTLEGPAVTFDEIVLGLAPFVAELPEGERKSEAMELLVSTSRFTREGRHDRALGALQTALAVLRLALRNGASAERVFFSAWETRLGAISRMLGRKAVPAA